MTNVPLKFVSAMLALAFFAGGVSGDQPVADDDSTLVGTMTMPSIIGDKPANRVGVSAFEQKSQKAGSFVNAPKREKNLWADSWLFVDVPRLDDEGKSIPEEKEADEAGPRKRIPAAERIGQFIKIEEWYNQAPPTLEGKYVLVEFSASWCPVCRREIPDLNHWHEKFGEELVVISIYETDRQSIDTLPGDYQGKDMKYYVGIDSKRRTANALNIFGIPHAVLLEPQYGAVVWEGMPNQPNYELTDEIIERVLKVGRKLKEAEKL